MYKIFKILVVLAYARTGLMLVIHPESQSVFFYRMVGVVLLVEGIEVISKYFRDKKVAEMIKELKGVIK